MTTSIDDALSCQPSGLGLSPTLTSYLWRGGRLTCPMFSDVLASCLDLKVGRVDAVANATEVMEHVIDWEVAA